MRPEYDFSRMKGAVWGRYYKAYRANHKVEIHQADGAILAQYFKLEEGAVLLSPDVKKYFPVRKFGGWWLSLTLGQQTTNS